MMKMFEPLRNGFEPGSAFLAGAAFFTAVLRAGALAVLFLGAAFLAAPAFLAGAFFAVVFDAAFGLAAALRTAGLAVFVTAGATTRPLAGLEALPFLPFLSLP